MFENQRNNERPCVVFGAPDECPLWKEFHNKDKKKEIKMTHFELRRIRKGLELTQTQFAILLGYTHFSRISQMETGKENIPKTTVCLARMFQMHGVPDEWLAEVCQRQR